MRSVAARTIALLLLFPSTAWCSIHVVQTFYVLWFDVGQLANAEQSHAGEDLILHDCTETSKQVISAREESGVSHQTYFAQCG